MTKSLKVTVLIALSIIMVMVSVPFYGMTYAAAKPAQVKISKVQKSTKNAKIKVTWKKAKNAKKYQFYLKKGSANYKLAKTTTNLTYTFKVSYDKTYKFKVRGVNGSTKGKFSAVKSVKIAKPAEPDNPHGIPVGSYFDFDFNKYYDLPYQAPVIKDVKLSEYAKSPVGGYTFTGWTKDGYYVAGAYADPHEIFKYQEDPQLSVYMGNYGDLTSDSYNGTIIDGICDYTNEKCEWNYGVIEGSGAMKGALAGFYCQNDNIKVYWTIDGTEPVIGQEDEVGWIPYLEEGYKIQTKGTITHSDGVTGIGKMSKELTMHMAHDYSGQASEWIKVYKNDEGLIGEQFIFSAANYPR